MADASTGRDPEVQAMLDKEAIREATMRVCRGVDRLDADLVNSAYHPDARDDHPGVVYTGETVGPGLVETLRERMTSTSHNATTQSIEIDGDTAVCESYSIGRHVLADGRRLHSLTRYLDRFERRAGEWKIIHRLTVVDDTEILPPLEGSPANPARARDRTDPSYDFFTA